MSDFANYEEEFAAKNAEQYIGCVECKRSHHKTSICPNCNRCFFNQKIIYDKENIHAPIVNCKCGKTYLWD